MESYVLDGKIVIKLKDGCKHCLPKVDELSEILNKFDEGGIIVRDFKLTLELTSDWIGEHAFHLNRVTLEERK